MNYNRTDLTKSPKQIVKDVIESVSSQLLIPPQYSGNELGIGELLSKKKSIGLYSSGSTDNPKCIWNSFENLVKNGKRTSNAFEISSDHKLLILAKPWHVAGLSWAIMAEEIGCNYDFITTKKDESKKWLEAIQLFQPDYLLTVPPVFRALYNKDWFIKNIVTGGTPLVQEDFEPLKNHCETIFHGYGQTEAGGLISVLKHNISDEYHNKLHQNCGQPIEGVSLETRKSKKGESEIFIKSETAYINKLYNSGDLGHIDNGHIYLTGRREKIISSKG